MQRSAYDEELATLQRKYDAALASLGFAPGDGVSVVCPSCGRPAWLTIPKDRRGHDDYDGTPVMSCPTACGYFGPLATFAPTSQPQAPLAYDTHASCRSCDVQFAVDGIVYRRPCCHIENPREVMQDAVARIRSRVRTPPAPVTRADLEDQLGLLVSTFDGVMRRMVAVACQTARDFLASEPPQPRTVAIAALPPGISFQNLAGARQKLLALGWDMAAAAGDWAALVRLFQKRHLVAHRLGVVDQEYMTKTQDVDATVGKRVPLSADEVLAGADACVAVVRDFFGNFLS